MTGLYGNKTDVLSVPGTLRLPNTTLFEQVDALTAGAYANAAIGKWHIGGSNNPTHPNDQGVAHFVGWDSGALPDYFAWERTENGTTSPSTDYATSHITDEAIDWIDRQTMPWLLWLAHSAPHTPFHLPPDSLYTRTQTNGNLNQYLAMIESMDHEIGRLLDSMTPAQRSNTLVIFLGDNGTPNQVLQGYPSGRGKGSLYQGGIHVPMIVAGSGVTRVDESEGALIHALDIFATISEVVGPDLAGGINNSFSFKDLLSDPNAATRPYNLSEIASSSLEGYTLRNERYKLIAFADGRQELYDLTLDPFELTDLIPGGLTGDQAALLAELDAEAMDQIAGWSCNDAIRNGEEQDGDCDVTTAVVNPAPSEHRLRVSKRSEPVHAGNRNSL